MDFISDLRSQKQQTKKSSINNISKIKIKLDFVWLVKAKKKN